MPSVEIEYYNSSDPNGGAVGSELAIFFFSDGGVASCHHNDDYMITECYYDRVDPKYRIEGFVDHEYAETIWDFLEGSKVSVKEWKDDQKVTEEMVNYVLNWMVTDQLLDVKEIAFDGD